MCQFSLLYARSQRSLLKPRLKSVLSSITLLAYAAVVTFMCWSVSPSVEMPIPATPVRLAVASPMTPSLPYTRLQCITPVSPSRYDDFLVESLASPFSSMDLGPGLKKATSKRGKNVRWAVERNTLRYGTKWIGLEDEDPFGEHFTEDVVLTPGKIDRTDMNDVAEVRDCSVYWIDEDGDVLMEE